MKIFLEKFGSTLVSRQTGREAFAALQPLLLDLQEDEELVLDCAGTITLSPSWADEFLTPLLKSYGKRFILERTENASIQATKKILEEIHKISFPTR